MPIQSYLIYPKPEEKEVLLKTLNEIPSCETMEAENEDLIILVTDTVNEVHEGQLHERLKKIPQLQGMALVFAQEDEQHEH